MDPSQSADLPAGGPASAVSEGPHSAAPAARRTLPPPEWMGFEGPRSAASIALGRLTRGEPVQRRSGPRAELESLFAAMHAASRTGDGATERTTAAELARALMQRGSEFDEALRLARRSLLLGEDPALRDELSGWFASLGESAIAAATLRPLLSTRAGAEAGLLLTRIGSLLSRAGEATAARAAYEQALAEAPADPNPAELLAAIGAWSPEVVTPEDAARFYLVASDARERLGERAAAFENVLRAFEIAPESSAAVDRLARLLSERGRAPAADEVRREHAAHLGPGARSVHLRRLRDALRDGDMPAALGAALDARLDAEIDVKSVLAALAPRDSGAEAAVLGFDELLERLGLFDLLAARLELGGELLTGAERARVRLALGRLYAGPLEQPERAAEAWVEALAADPGNEEAREALGRLAESTGDSTALVEALVRAGEAGAATPERAACLRDLRDLAEARLNDAPLAFWAELRASSLPEAEARLGEAASRLEPRVRLADQAIEGARRELDRTEGLERVEPLTRLLSLLSGRPDEADATLPVLLELIELSPSERSFQSGVERLLRRQGRLDELEAFYERLLARGSSDAERARLSLSLSSLRTRRGDIEGALAVLAPILLAKGSHSAAWCMALLLAGQRGDETLRAHALHRLSATRSAPVRAVLCAVAGEIFLRAGHLDLAKAAVEQAVASDPSLARPIAARAAVALAFGDSAGADAMERAMGVVVPRAKLCQALANAYDQLGEPLLALAFGQRRIALRPGDLDAARDRLVRNLKLGDGKRLTETLAWLFAQPQPLQELGELIATALRTLAPLEPEQGTVLARRALDVLGPRTAEIRLAVLSVADITGERGLGLAALERWLSSGAASNEQAEVLLDLARRRRASGDSDGSARSLMRAMREGAWATAVLAELDVAPAPKSADGDIALLSARAEALSALSEADQRGTALAWRELGAAYWDLAGNKERAIRAWERASALDPEQGIENLASDLCSFAGVDLASQHLAEYAERRTDHAEAARVLALSAAIAVEASKPLLALKAAVRALELDPSRADVLAVIERTTSAADVDLLERSYSLTASGALGRFGQRAVHYRAARQLEKHRDLPRALSHAIQALEAVPSEGALLVMVARLASQVGGSAEVVRALARVASSSRDAATRAAWLKRAALLAGQGPEGLREKIEVLLRALHVSPDADVLRALGDAIAELILVSPEDREILELRVQRAFSALESSLHGPEGARLAVFAARVLLETLQAPERAMSALQQAVDCDASIDEYAELERFADRLAPSAETFLARLSSLTADRMANVGPALLALGASLADARGEARHGAELLVEAARRAPEESDLVRRAELTARQLKDPALLALALEAIPIRQRVQALIELADAAEQSGDLSEALEILEKARAFEGTSPGDSVRILDLLIDRYRRLGNTARLEELLEEQIQDDGLDVQQKSKRAAELAALVGGRGDHERALTILELLLRDVPRDPGLLRDFVAFARQAGDKSRLIRGLSTLIELTSDPALARALVSELAEFLELSGDLSGARSRWSQLLQISPEDPVALSALEREAERRGDWESLIQLLARRAGLAATLDEVRRIRLRRATVLEHRLGRPDEARVELEALTANTGDHWSVLRVLADLNERLGAPLRAAPLWLRASALATDRNEASDLACRACEAYLSGSDVESARRVLDGMLTWAASERALKLAVDIERRRENPMALAEALEDLARGSTEEPEQRAALLVEAAQASLAAGAFTEALSRAERAAELAPAHVEAQLLFRKLAYQKRGAPVGLEGARATEALRALSSLSPEQSELRAYLLAELADSTGSGGSQRILEEAEALFGARPLIAVGLAERLAHAGATDRALPYFDIAVGANLQGLRARGEVALEAADAARELGDRDRAENYLEIAVADPGSRERAVTAARDLQTYRNRSAEPHVSPVEDSEPGALVHVDRALSDAGRYSERPSFEPREERPLGRSEPAASSPEVIRNSGVNGRYSMRAGDESVSSRPPPSEPPAAADDSSTKLLKLSTDEAALYSALASGSIDAGRSLIADLEHRSDRTRDLVSVCRRLTMALPGDPWALGRLHDAALADKNVNYARAVEHVLYALQPGQPRLAPPPLEEQIEQPDAVRALLLREQSSTALEALALVWEGAEHVFRRDPSTYGVTGLERVPLAAPTPVARSYSAAARSLGMPRTPLFQRRSTGPVTMELALLSPPAIVLSGDVRQETPELAYQLGVMLVRAMPQFVLLMGSSEAQARGVLEGLGFAFGPPERARKAGKVPSLAEVLWESIPARLQRRLRELCNEPDALNYESAMRAARLTARRAGLFVSGDLRVALRETCVEEGIGLDALESTDRILDLCRASASARSLVLLSTSAEYAQTRWQPGRAAR